MNIMRSMLPLYYGKCQIALIDDDVGFLKDTKALFIESGFNAEPHAFSSPIKALEFLEMQKENSIASPCLDVVESRPGCRNFDLVNEFSNCLEDLPFALVMVDYFMPPMNGVDFSTKLREMAPDIKILMLTGEADETVAVDAFNDGVIDGFVKKESAQIAKVVLETAKRMVFQYFIDQTNLVLSTLNPGEPAGIPEWVSDKTVVSFIAQKMQIIDAQSLYLIDERGVFSITLKNGEQCKFACFHEDEMQNLYELLDDMDADQTVIAAVKYKTHIAFLPESDDVQGMTLSETESIEAKGKVFYFAKASLSG